MLKGANGRNTPSIVFRSAEDTAAFLECHPSTLRLWNARGCPGIQPRRYDVQQIIRDGLHLMQLEE